MLCALCTVTHSIFFYHFRCYSIFFSLSVEVCMHSRVVGIIEGDKDMNTEWDLVTHGASNRCSMMVGIMIADRKAKNIIALKSPFFFLAPIGYKTKSNIFGLWLCSTLMLSFFVYSKIFNHNCL